MPFIKVLSETRRRALLVDHQDGFKPTQLVERYGISVRTVYRILADGSASREKRYKPAPHPKRELKPCGTNAAYARHKRKGEYPCTLCLAAHADDQRKRVAL